MTSERPVYPALNLFDGPVEILDLDGLNRLTQAMERHPGALRSLITHPRALTGLRTPAGVVDPRHADLLTRDPDLTWVPAAFRIGERTYGAEGAALTVTVQGVTHLVAETEHDLPWKAIKGLMLINTELSAQTPDGQIGVTVKAERRKQRGQTCLPHNQAQVIQALQRWASAAARLGNPDLRGMPDYTAAQLLFPELSAIRATRRYIKGGALQEKALLRQLERHLTPQGRRAARSLLASLTDGSDWRQLRQISQGSQLLRRHCGAARTSAYLVRVEQEHEGGLNAAGVLHPTMLELHEHMPGPVNSNLRNALRDSVGLIDTLLQDDLTYLHAEITALRLNTQIERQLTDIEPQNNPRLKALIAEELILRGLPINAPSGEFLAAGPAHWEADFEVGGVRYSAELAARQGDLDAESAELKHCVRGNGYVTRAAAGQIHLLLVRTVNGPNRTPRFTAEIDVSRQLVMQARGKHNRVLSPEDQAVMRSWSALSGVSWHGDQIGADVGGERGDAGKGTAKLLPFSGLPQAQRSQLSEDDQSRAQAITTARERLNAERNLSPEEAQRLTGGAVMHLTRLRQQITRALSRVKPMHVGLGATDSRFSLGGPPEYLIGDRWVNESSVIHTCDFLRLKDSPYGPVLSGLLRNTLISGSLIGRPEEQQTRMRFTNGNTMATTGTTMSKMYWNSHSATAIMTPIGPRLGQVTALLSDQLRRAGLPVQDARRCHDLEQLTDLRPARLPRSKRERQALQDRWAQRKQALGLTVLPDGTLSGPHGPLKASVTGDGQNETRAKFEAYGRILPREIVQACPPHQDPLLDTLNKNGGVTNVLIRHFTPTQVLTYAELSPQPLNTAIYRALIGTTWDHGLIEGEGTAGEPETAQRLFRRLQRLLSRRNAAPEIMAALAKTEQEFMAEVFGFTSLIPLPDYHQQAG